MSSGSPFFVERTSTFQIINKVGKGLGAIGIDPFKLNADKIFRKVKKQTGVDYYDDKMLEGLNKLVWSVNHEATPNTFGKIAMKKLLERTLKGRLEVEQHLSAHPDILNKPINSPVFIIGMPRTGTTILHALLHEDPSHRSPLSWECLLPFPVPTPDTFTDNIQLNTIRKEFDQLFKLVPDFLTKHYLAADSPQECLGINALDFNSFQFLAQMNMPSYLEWKNHEADELSTMQFHKRFLQYLQSGGVMSERWLLKTPMHLSRLKVLFDVYPDARIIMTHRHPSKVVPSAASLVSSVRSLYSDHEDPFKTGKEQLDIWSMYFDRFLSDRQRINKEDQFIDLKFEDFVKDQLGTVRKIYERFGWTLSAKAEENMQAFLSNNPKDKHGKHNYSLEQFGLTESDIDSKYANYIQFLSTL
ncbi:MAG: sulfotransferase [Bacteroidota bacterium]